MDARSVIADVRAGRSPTAESVRAFAAGIASGAVSDAQAGAFAMAVCLRGLGDAGRVALTLGMRDSGRVMAWDLPGPVLDKHSTGGIGDVVSLPLAAALAVCGGYVPMISGRGLGHTGGTLDKLGAIPGYRVDLAPEAFGAQVRDLGCAIVAASSDLAPADRRLYAIRDVSATVESIDLITASILSKKLAAGLDALVLDVKCGSGAFMQTPAEARALAQALVATATGAGCAAAALISDMDQPLMADAGNALEVAAAMRLLTGQGGAGEARMLRLVQVLGGRALWLGGVAVTEAAGQHAIATAIASGAAAERFCAMVAAQGGPRDFARTWAQDLPHAPHIVAVPAPVAGVVCHIDTRALGFAVLGLGAGRVQEGDIIDPRVGLRDIVPVGTQVARGQPLCLVHAADAASAARASGAIAAACQIGPEAPQALPDLEQGWITP